jgi:hypothetical protein
VLLVDFGIVSILIHHELVRPGIGAHADYRDGDAFDCMKLNLTLFKTCGDGEREA